MPPTMEMKSTRVASGSFDVKLSPQLIEGMDPALGRSRIDKQFYGDLTAVSLGQMLSAGTAVKGSAGYVAIETVTGLLHDRLGSFSLQHCCSMARGQTKMAITVVPDSGSDQLTGLTGTLTIDILDRKHFYRFEYELPMQDPSSLPSIHRYAWNPGNV